MEIREAILKEEFDRIGSFLGSFNLDYSSEHLDKTFYLIDNDTILGTISHQGSIIKCLAVVKDYQGENLSSKLITYIISYFNSINIYSYTVYTKPEYEEVFKSFGFKLLVKTSKTCLLESGINTIFDSINGIKTQIKMSYGEIDDSIDIAATIINGNPFTLGHQELCVNAANKHDLLLVFIVEEDESFFTFKERFSMAYLSLSRYKNIVVIPSTKYMVSLMTFPNYFYKDEKIKEDEYSLVDALLFKDYFMKYLYIKHRYVGSETKGYMARYNQVLSKELGDSLVIVKRYKNEKGVEISASTVREKIINNDLVDILDYIPREINFIILGKAYELK